jgi:hypothetical protein
LEENNRVLCHGGAAHNPNNMIAIGTLIHVKERDAWNSEGDFSGPFVATANSNQRALKMREGQGTMNVLRTCWSKGSLRTEPELLLPTLLPNLAAREMTSHHEAVGR